MRYQLVYQSDTETLRFGVYWNKVEAEQLLAKILKLTSDTDIKTRPGRWFIEEVS